MRPCSSRAGKSTRRQSFIRRLSVEPLEPRFCFSLSVPAFSSLPGANHTIYLDFDGHVTSGTTWNTATNSPYYNEDPIDSPAWSLDADHANFTQTELDTIARVWGRVAEDFSPFHVNVTTVEPPINDLRRGEVSGDTKWGVRAVVSIETTVGRCGCGGIAYIGSFNDTLDEPVFVYNSSESGVAEAISHEVGHSLYLQHDGLVGADGVPRTTDDVEYYAGHGSGATAWAPIMGNSYNRNVTTWDKGEYYNSNNANSSANYSNGPDDLNVIATRNGFGFKVDDHGNSTASASAMNVAGTVVGGSGIIGSRTDVDVFSFTTGAGAVTLNINPVDIRPNLDIQADLLGSDGSLIASYNPATALNAVISETLAAGLYYLRVDGVSFGDPTNSTPTGYTDYASIGQFSVSGTIVDAGALPTISVNDVSVSEAGGIASFSIHLNGALEADASVSYATASGSAIAGADFTTTIGTATFTPGGPTTILVEVPLINDSAAEALESFNLVLSNPSGDVLVADTTATASITNDDAEFSINNASATEGNVSKRGVISYSTITFTVSLAQPVDHAVAFSYSTGSAGDTATAGLDYVSASAPSSILAGQSGVSIPITVIGDNTVETNETFSVIISSSAGTLVDAVGTGTILDNDSKGGGKGGGGGGGPPRANEADDFTIIDHTDLAEPLSGAIESDHTHAHTHEHKHSHSHGLSSFSQHAGVSLSVSETLLVTQPFFLSRAIVAPFRENSHALTNIGFLATKSAPNGINSVQAIDAALTLDLDDELLVAPPDHNALSFGSTDESGSGSELLRDIVLSECEDLARTPREWWRG